MKTVKTDLFFALIVLWLFSFNCNSGYASKPVPSKWGIFKEGNTQLIIAGILEQRINLGNQKISSRLFLNGELLNEDFSGELAVVFHKASPNRRPKGIGYSAESGVEQTDTVKNQTDALAVKNRKNTIEQGVQWPDSFPVSKENFNHVFTCFNTRISTPEKGVKRLTLTFSSKKLWSDVSLEINYEIYTGFPAIRKWIKFYNQGSQWLKISDLLLEELNLNKKYSHKVLLTPNSRNIDPSILAFSDTTASSGIIASSEIPSKLRHLSVNGTIGYNPDYFEWVIGPGESFRSDPVFIFAFSGASYPTVSAVSTALDRCVETRFHTFLNAHILRPVSQGISIAPVFCSWTNYSAAINDSNMRVAAKLASRIGFKCFQLDAGWSDTGPAGGWAVSTPKPNRQNFKDLCGLSNYIHSEHMETGLWYSVFINEQEADKSGQRPGLFSLPIIRRAGGLGLSLCYDKSRERYVNDILYLHKTYKAEYFKQDLSNICYGDIAEGHESRTLKESYLRGLRGLFATQDEIHRQAPEIWLQLSHEIYWETPGPEADIAVLQHVDSYHSAPNEYWGAGNRSKLVNPAWKYDVDSLRQKLIQGAWRARTLLYAHRGLPLDRVEVFGAVTTNFKGSLSTEIQDRQICSWLTGAPISFSGDLGSLTEEHIKCYRDRFKMLDNLQKKYGIYANFQFSGVPVPTDEGWHWWGKLNGEGFGAVVVLRGSAGTQRQRINIPWVKASKKYQLKALFSDENLGVFSGSQLINGELTLSLPPFGQEIIEISAMPVSQKSILTGESQWR